MLVCDDAAAEAELVAAYWEVAAALVCALEEGATELCTAVVLASEPEVEYPPMTPVKVGDAVSYATEYTVPSMVV